MSDIHHGGSGLPHGVPDLCAVDPTAEHVDVGTVRTITGPVTISGICVEGELTLAGQGCRISNIQVHDTGSLILADGLEWIVRDTPIQTDIDPEAFGTGAVVFGRMRASGQLRTPHVRLAAEVQLGATTLQLSAAPVGWAVGHRLALADSRQRTMADASWSEEVTIAAIAGLTVTLTAPTRWAHLGARRPDGSLRFLPHVANLSRSIVIRSENPAGVRGHILASQRADVDLRGVEFLDLGRTTADPLNSTTFDAAGAVTHIGTNQIGRYPLHFHHVFGPAIPPTNGKQFTVSGCSIHNFAKWGLAVHNTHFGLVQDNVVWDGQGAGIVTEDGSETANLFAGNFVAHVFNTTWVMGPADEGQALTDPQMRRGNGVIFRGPGNDLRRTVVADTREPYNFLTQSAEENENPSSGFPVVRIPKGPGLDTTVDANITEIQIYKRGRGLIDDNEAYGATEFGIGFWVAPNADTQHSTPITNLRIWHTSPEGAAVFAKYSDIEFVDLELLNEGGKGGAYSQFNPATAMTIGGALCPSQFLRADIRGFNNGWLRTGQIGQAGEWVVLDSTFQNRTDFLITNDGEYSAGSAYTPDGVQRPRFNWINPKHSAIPGLPHTFIDAHFKVLGSDPPMRREFELKVVGYQGVAGDDFRLWFTQAPGEEVGPCVVTRPELVGYVCALDAPPLLPPPPIVTTPVDCVVSAWSEWSAWTPLAPVPPATVATIEQRTRTRTVLTPPSGGGVLCGALTETEQRPIVVVPPPQTWLCTVAKTEMIFPNGDKKITLRCPPTFPFVKGDLVVVTKP